MEKRFKCFIYIPEKPFLEPVRILMDHVPDDPSIPQEFRGQKASTTPIYPNKVVKAEDWLFKISNSCIDNYTIIRRGTVIKNSAVMDRVLIGEEAEITSSIIGRHTTIRSVPTKLTRISSLSVVGNNVWIDAGCTLKNAKIYPHLRLTENLYEGEVTPTDPHTPRG